jgi:hypothetical protein
MSTPPPPIPPLHHYSFMEKEERKIFVVDECYFYFPRLINMHNVLHPLLLTHKYTRYFPALKEKLVEYGVFKHKKAMKEFDQSRSKWIKALKQKKKPLKKKRFKKEGKLTKKQIKKQNGGGGGIVSGMKNLFVNMKHKVGISSSSNQNKKKNKKQLKKSVIRRIDNIERVLLSFGANLDEYVDDEEEDIC